MKNFYNVLGNTLIANVTTSFLWFALTFWIYLETRSVTATAIVGGSYMLLTAVLGVPFGTIVDHYKKKKVMVVATAFTLIMYLAASLVFVSYPKAYLLDFGGPIFWLFIGTILLGAIVENIRNITLSTCVTLLVPKDRRDKANGLVGAVTGLAFSVTSIFSGLAIGQLGMGWTILIAVILTAVAVAHLYFIDIPEDRTLHDPELTKKVDFRGSIAAIMVVPGLMGLIFFTTFNNLIGGVFMALLDAYGLNLVSVEVWGVLSGVLSLGFIVGGIVIARKGLGSKPLRLLLLANIAMWIIGMTFTIRESIVLLAVGMFIYLCLIPVVEAVEQTILQRVVPFAKQGRVFGFAQSIEALAMPITAFIIGPIAEFIVIPYVKTEAGAAQFGWLLGAGEARGIALVFIIASIIGLVLTILAFMSRSYRLLSQYYTKA